MPYALNFYHDQFVPSGEEEAKLAPGHRIFYVRYGEVSINGELMSADSVIYTEGDVTISAEADWSQIWRWELAAPNAEPVLFKDEGSLSKLRLAEGITTLDMAKGSQWIFRLDQIISAAGRVTPRHQHKGPGIRCLVQGTFNVQQSDHAIRDITPGDAWWESGTEAVIAWGSQQMPSRFLRGMIVPADLEGKLSNIWLDPETTAPKANWKLYKDQLITV